MIRVNGRSSDLIAWLSAIRVRQWPKNLLVFLPAFLSHQILEWPLLSKSLLAFVAFSLCASSAYIVNDLADRDDDRHHPAKQARPFASGQLSPRSGVLAASGLLICSAVLALQLDFRFVAALGTYYALTWVYTNWIRAIAILDVMVLAGLYASRIVAGSAATAISLSYWFLGLASFMFFSLATVKRYAEIRETVRCGEAGNRGRGYDAADLPLLLAIGVASGYCSVVVMALYINSADAMGLYRHREILWLVCPLLLFWITRVWRLAVRGQLPDDPVVFATSDSASFVVLGLTTAIVVLSI